MKHSRVNRKENPFTPYGTSTLLLFEIRDLLEKLVKQKAPRATARRKDLSLMDEQIECLNAELDDLEESFKRIGQIDNFLAFVKSGAYESKQVPHD